MKKIFIALSVLAVLGFSLAPALANVPGARDIAPGSEFKSYFLVSKARVDTGSGPSTLLQISETKGMVTVVGVSVKWSNLHFNFYTRDSVWVHDVKVPITRWQTLLKDIGQMITEMSDVERAQLAVTFEGQAYYAGYVVVTEIQFGSADNIVADVLQLNLSNGLAAISNIPVKCYAFNSPCPQINRVLNSITATGVLGTWTTTNYEVFNGHAMAAADSRVWTGLCADAGWFALYPRYLINDANSADTYWLLLRSSVKTAAGALIAEIPFHTWVINKAEDYRSTTINIRELSILSAKAIIPSVLKVSLPYVGQVNLKIPGESDPGSITYIPAADPYLNMELFGWNWMYANNGAASATVNWAGMSLIAADAGTGIGAYPNY